MLVNLYVMCLDVVPTGGCNLDLLVSLQIDSFSMLLGFGFSFVCCCCVFDCCDFTNLLWTVRVSCALFFVLCCCIVVAAVWF